MFEAVKHTLMRSLRQVVLTQQFVRSKGVEVKRINWKPPTIQKSTHCVSKKRKLLIQHIPVIGENPPKRED